MLVWIVMLSGSSTRGLHTALLLLHLQMRPRLCLVQQTSILLLVFLQCKVCTGLTCSVCINDFIYVNASLCKKRIKYSYNAYRFNLSFPVLIIWQQLISSLRWLDAARWIKHKSRWGHVTVKRLSCLSHFIYFISGNSTLSIFKPQQTRAIISAYTPFSRPVNVLRCVCV